MTASTLICLNAECGRVMDRQETAEAPDATGVLHFYICPGCGRKAALIFEHEGGMSQHAQGWVENEVASRGHFFPRDYGPGGGGPRAW